MADKINLEKLLPGVQKNVLLKNYTTYKIGGPAKYFFDAKTQEDLLKAINSAKELKMKFFVLGGGSNLLVSDKGFQGLVIRVNIEGIEQKENKIFAGAGVDLPKLAFICAEKGLSGLEWASGVPGTLGGAIYGHAQAFGLKISDAIGSVKALDMQDLKVKNFSKEECEFSLKNSIFKKNKNLVIISAEMNFVKKDPEEIKNKIKELLEYRKNHQPAMPSAGSVFVNPETVITDKKLLEKFPELSDFAKKGFVPAGYLIQKTGLQGMKIGGAEISKMHANFIVNTGNAKAEDIMALIKLAKQKVKNIFKINLEIEVQFLGVKIAKKSPALALTDF